MKIFIEKYVGENKIYFYFYLVNFYRKFFFYFVFIFILMYLQKIFVILKEKRVIFLIFIVKYCKDIISIFFVFIFIKQNYEMRINILCEFCCFYYCWEILLRYVFE